MKLSEMKQILSAGDIQLTKSLGQNFLHDQNQLNRIVNAAEISGTDKILEIGPGLGPLTELLVAKAAEVLAIEKDRRLVEVLEPRFAKTENLKLIQTDALRYLCDEARDWSNWKLVANLPYSVASPILVELAEADGPPVRIVATLQLEVAQRIVAKARDEHYGILSLLMQLRYEPRELMKIPASCFFPPPDVDSAFINLVRREQPLLTRQQSVIFTKVVKRAFSQRRKMMMKLLKADWPVETLQDAFQKIQVAPTERAEKLTLEQFVALTKILSPAVS